MKNFLHKHKSLWSQGGFLLDVTLGVLFVFAGILSTYYANSYTISHASNSVSDIILDSIPVVNVDFIFSDGAVIFFVIALLLIIYEPRRIPFVLKSSALFFIIRSSFMIMTHLAPPPYGSYIDPTEYMRKFSSGNDLFFSAHTGFPFLFALLFWEHRKLRYFFIACTLIGGVSVLLGHLHYSIDVFSALFITYGIFKIARKFFRKDYVLFMQNPVSV